MSKRIIISLAAVLLVMTSAAFATGIPVTTDPKNFPTVWTEAVYNGSGDDIGTGVIVRWDFDASTGDFADMCAWVEQGDTAEDIRTAGVVPFYGDGIDNGSTGTIIIKGPAKVRKQNTTTVTDDDIVGDDGTGYVIDWTGGTSDECMLGVAIKSAGSSAIIYIDPTIDDD